MAAPEFKAKPKGIKSNIVRAVFNKFRPKPTPRDKALSKYTKGSPAFDTQRKLEDRIDAQKTSLSAAERAKALKNQLKMEAARKQGAPPLQRRQAPAPTPTPTPTPAPVKRPRTEPISIDRFDKMLPPKEFVARQRAAYGNKVPSWQVLKKEAEGYGFVVPDSPKDVVEHNRLMNRNLQYRKYKRQEIQKILSGDPERAKAEILDMKRKGVDVDIESPMPKHLAASTKTDELGRMVPDRPPIQHSPEKNARLLFEARRKAAAEAAEKRLAGQPDNLIQDLAETVASQQPPEPAPISLEGDPFAIHRARVNFGVGRGMPPQVKRQGTGGASIKATPTIARLVGQPKKMSKTKKALIGATIASPAAIVGSAYLDDDEDSESPDLPTGFTQDDYEKYLKAAEEAAAQARKAAAGQ